MRSPYAEQCGRPASLQGLRNAIAESIRCERFAEFGGQEGEVADGRLLQHRLQLGQHRYRGRHRFALAVLRPGEWISSMSGQKRPFRPKSLQVRISRGKAAVWIHKCVSGGYTRRMKTKDAGLRIRVERELRDDFLEVCRIQDRPAAQVIREFMRRYVAKHRVEAQPGPLPPETITKTR